MMEPNQTPSPPSLHHVCCGCTRHRTAGSKRSHGHPGNHWAAGVTMDTGYDPSVRTVTQRARMPPVCLLLWVLSLMVGAVTCLDIDECSMSLGMQSGEIPDHAITASSSYDDESVGPANARIRTETNGGAWCPQQAVSKDIYEYLQIDLGELKVITIVETQGRFGNGQGQEYADQYLLEYQREDLGNQWFRFRNRRGQEIIPGNTNTYIAEIRNIDPPIITRRLRFIPFSTHPKTICMRVELFGCRWKDGTVAYDMPQGERRGTEVDLLDFTYDGKIQNNYLAGGLGQLMDGEQGQSNFRLDPKNLRIKGYEWIGWRNETFGTKPVEIIFKFDAVRNFTAVRIHSNNMFSKEVRVFRMAKIYMSIGGKYFLGEPLEFKYMRDTLIEYSRQVIIPLQHHVGRYVKMKLYFDAKWMMLSEVQFESEYAVGNFTEELPPTTVSPPAGRLLTPHGSEQPNIVKVIDVFPDDGHKSNYSRAGANSIGDTEDNSEDISLTTPSVIDPSKARNNNDDEFIGIIIGTLAALILILFAVIIAIVMRHRKNKANNNHRTLKPVELPHHVTLDLNNVHGNGMVTNGKVSNGNMYNCVATSDGESDREGACCTKLDPREYYREVVGDIQTRKLPELPRTPESTDTNTSSRDYATLNHLNQSTLIVNTTDANNTVASATPSMPPPPYQNTLSRKSNPGTTSPMMSPPLRVGSPYTTTGTVDGTLPNIQGVSGNTVYACPGNLDLWTDDLSVAEFPRDKLKFVQKLGEGQFGEVHLCETMGVADIIGDDFLVNRASSRSMLVACKMLRSDASEPAKADFHKEVKIMSRLKDANVVRVLGVCTQDEPLAVVVEYMKYGDLHQFLQTHMLAEGSLPRKKSAKPITYGCLIYMATQIASGMKYLESLNMVHRDLAARNCLVGHAYNIKVSDFGMSRSLYSSDYYRIEGKAVLPIRWMAWESVLLGKFSCKSDVWSFGVALWEIMMFSKEQPFNNLSDEQVIENCGRFYRNDGSEQFPIQPIYCPREIYDLMKECWNRDDTIRPTFREIHMFLQRKNMGYNPREEKTMATLQRNYSMV